MIFTLDQFRQIPGLKRKLMYIALLLLHSVYKLLLNTFKLLVNLKNYTLNFLLGEHVPEVVKFTQFVRKVAELPRIPAHIAFIVPDSNSDTLNSGRETDSVPNSEEPPPPKIDLHKLAEVISWTWAARIPLLSLYDYYGQIQAAHKELEVLLQQQLLKNYLIGKKEGIPDLAPLPTIKFYNVNTSNGYSNGNPVSSVTADSHLHIALFTYKDGKSAIAAAARTICSGAASPIPLNEHSFNTLLSSAHFSKLPDDLPRDPDVLVILGDVRSTLGFLPWEIRLSEMNWAPSLPLVTSDDLLQVFKKWAGIQQRHGT